MYQNNGLGFDRPVLNQPDLSSPAESPKCVGAKTGPTHESARSRGSRTDRNSKMLSREVKPPLDTVKPPLEVKPPLDPVKPELLGFGAYRSFLKDNYHAYVMADG